MDWRAAPHEAPPPRWLFRGLTMNGTVLIIEDDARIANWVKVYFERAGFSAEVAYDGESGLALARNLGSGPDNPRSDASPSRRRGAVQNPAPGVRRSDNHADGQGSPLRASHRAGQWSRRLRRQALRPGGAHCAAQAVLRRVKDRVQQV